MHFKFPSKANAVGPHFENPREKGHDPHDLISYEGLEYGEDWRTRKGGLGLGRS